MISACATESLPISRVCLCIFLIFDRADEGLEDGFFQGVGRAEIQRDPEHDQERFTGPLRRSVLSGSQLQSRMQRAQPARHPGGLGTSEQC